MMENDGKWRYENRMRWGNIWKHGMMEVWGFFRNRNGSMKPARTHGPASGRLTLAALDPFVAAEHPVSQRSLLPSYQTNQMNMMNIDELAN